MTRFEIVQIGCTRNNTIHVAYVHCNYKESNSDWIRIFLGYLKLFTISICHKTTFKHFLKNFDRVTGVHQSCSLRCGHTMQFLNPIFLPIFWSILISTKSYGVSTEVKSGKKKQSLKVDLKCELRSILYRLFCENILTSQWLFSVKNHKLI